MSEVIQQLGSQIAYYRKKAGLTQSALAEKISVSTQAVSRWERGGAPDAAILPTLASALHVTIDQLYGIPSGQNTDIPQLLTEAFQGIPQDHLFEAAYHYAYAILKATLDSCEQPGEEFHRMLDTHENVDRRGAAMPPPYLVHVSSDLGIMSASFAKDLHYLLVMPEPEDGFASIMKSRAAYLQLFELLSRDHRLDMLLFLYGDSREGFTASKAARELGISEEQAEEILEELHDLNFLKIMRFSSADGELKVYQPSACYALIPFLYFGSELMVSQGASWLRYDTRERAFFPAPLGTNGVATQWGTKSQGNGGNTKPGLYGKL